MNRRRSTIKRASWKKGDTEAVSTSNKGPKETTPKHGKRNRVPYDAALRASKWQIDRSKKPKN